MTRTKKPTGKHAVLVDDEPEKPSLAGRPKRASTQPTGSRSKAASIPPPASTTASTVPPSTKVPSVKQTATGIPTVPAAAATMIERGGLRPPAKPSTPPPMAGPPSRASHPPPTSTSPSASPSAPTSGRRPPGRRAPTDPRAPEPMTTMPGSGAAIRPPAGRATAIMPPPRSARAPARGAPDAAPDPDFDAAFDAATRESAGPAPVAPAPATTAIGRPTEYRVPAKPARARKQPPPLPGTRTTSGTTSSATKRPAVPPPARAKAAGPPDPVQLRTLLEAILAAPDDDAPRRAYAELLEAHGDARGEFIRIGLDPEDVEAEVFTDLHARHSAKWTKSLRALGKTARWRWHRGFVHELRVTGWDTGCTPENLAAVLGAEPVAELSIDGGEADLLARLVAVPGIERVRRLAVSGWNPDEGGSFVGKVLGRAKRLTGVTELRAGVKLGTVGIEALVDSRGLDSVVHLAVSSGHTSTATFAAFAASPLGQRLEVLEWLRDPITRDMATLIAMMPSLRTFVASTGQVDACKSVLQPRFRNRFVIEDEPGMQCLIDGVRGVSYRPQPKR